MFISQCCRNDTPAPPRGHSIAASLVALTSLSNFPLIFAQVSDLCGGIRLQQVQEQPHTHTRICTFDSIEFLKAAMKTI